MRAEYCGLSIFVYNEEGLVMTGYGCNSSRLEPVGLRVTATDPRPLNHDHRKKYKSSMINTKVGYGRKLVLPSLTA